MKVGHRGVFVDQFPREFQGFANFNLGFREPLDFAEKDTEAAIVGLA